MPHTNMTLPSGADLLVIMSRKTVERLSTTCFRGVPKARAGNFFLWNGFIDLIADREIAAGFTAEIQANLDETQDPRNVVSVVSLTLRYHRIVGWSSTVPKDQIPPSCPVKAFEPSKRACGLLVDDDTLEAPQTHLVTFVCELKYDDDETAWVAIVHSLYPGPDIGNLSGDVSEREGVVFFDWDNPGSGTWTLD